MTRVNGCRVAFVFALISLLTVTAPSSLAQAYQWNKHIKAGRSDFSGGISEKYSHAWGEARDYPHFVKAEQELLAALSDTQAFPPGDLRTAETLGDLASTFSEEGKFAEAESRGNQAIAIMEASLSPDDPQLGHALINLASIYDSEGQPEKASPIWNRSLAILKKTGKPDPEVFSNLKFQASHMHDRNPAGAAHIYQYLVDLEGSTGASESDLRSLWEQLARVQRGSDAEESYTRILEGDKNIQGPDSKAAGADSQSLGKLYLDEGKYAAAWPLLQHSLEIIQQKAAPEHESKAGKMSDTSSLLILDRELAQAYVGAGKDPEAEELYEQIASLDESNTALDKTVADQFMTGDLRGLATAYRDERRFDEALETIKKSEALDDEIANSKFGKLHEKTEGPSIWSWLTQNDLAEIYREKGDTAAAEPLFQRSLETVPSRIVSGHPKLAQLLDNYATLLRDEGKYDQAEPLYKRALDVWSKSRYREHPDVATTLANYATMLRKIDRAAEAELLEARAAEIRAKASITSAPTS
jgi:tetratricopeptide (TPR) repeat protein